MKTALALLAALATTAPGLLHAQDADLAELRTALEKYQDVNVALAEGYIPEPTNTCVSAELEGLPPELGGMGIHFMHPGLLQITGTDPVVDGTGMHTDFTRPAMLLYEPQADGTLALVGVENLVFEAAWQAAGNTEPPMFNGRPWDRMADDPATEAHEAHGFAPHYDQHVWLFRDAAAGGELEPFNPNVSCEHHTH